MPNVVVLYCFRAYARSGHCSVKIEAATVLNPGKHRVILHNAVDASTRPMQAIPTLASVCIRADQAGN